MRVRTHATIPAYLFPKIPHGINMGGFKMPEADYKTPENQP
jgi:hypothetical protein